MSTALGLGPRFQKEAALIGLPSAGRCSRPRAGGRWSSRGWLSSSSAAALVLRGGCPPGAGPQRAWDRPLLSVCSSPGLSNSALCLLQFRAVDLPGRLSGEGMPPTASWPHSPPPLSSPSGLWACEGPAPQAPRQPPCLQEKGLLASPSAL